jgi:hypothetical protein
VLKVPVLWKNWRCAGSAGRSAWMKNNWPT